MKKNAIMLVTAAMLLAFAATLPAQTAADNRRGSDASSPCCDPTRRPSTRPGPANSWPCLAARRRCPPWPTCWPTRNWPPTRGAGWNRSPIRPPPMPCGRRWAVCTASCWRAWSTRSAFAATPRPSAPWPRSQRIPPPARPPRRLNGPGPNCHARGHRDPQSGDQGWSAATRAAAADACLVAAERQLALGHREQAVAIYDAVRAADVPKPAAPGRYARGDPRTRRHPVGRAAQVGRRRHVRRGSRRQPAAAGPRRDATAAGHAESPCRRHDRYT